VNLLRRIWQDIIRGENIDLYLTIPLAIGLTVANTLGRVGDSQIPSLTLMILALVCMSLLGNRYRLVELTKSTTEGRDEVLLHEFPAEFESRLKQSSDVWMIGVTLGSTIKEHFTTLERILSRGGRVRVLIRDPDGATSQLISSNSYREFPADQIRSELNISLRRLCDLKSQSGVLEIRVLDHHYSIGITALDPTTAKGRIFVEYYTYRLRSTSVPKLVFQASDERWFSLYHEQVQVLWENGREWDCSKALQE
jgi:hypothetical protein